MAAFFGARTRPGIPLTDDEVAQILADGNDSEIEEFADDEENIVARVLDHLEESKSGFGDEFLEVDEAPTMSRSRESSTGRLGREINRELASARGRGRVMGRRQANIRSETCERVLVETVYTDKAHDYTPLMINQVRSPIDYFRDSFDDSFLEEVASCTNLYHLSKTVTAERRRWPYYFRLDVAECLKCLPETERRVDEPESQQRQSRQHLKIYKPVSMPSTAKRHDGYDHLAVSDDIKAPRTCRMEDCGSRSKIKCEKCNVYLCLSRDKNCFKAFHKP